MFAQAIAGLFVLLQLVNASPVASHAFDKRSPEKREKLSLDALLPTLYDL